MAKADDSKAPDQGAEGAEAPAAPAAEVLAPKIGQFYKLTEVGTAGSQKGIVSTNLFLVTEVGSTTGPKRDAKGAVITKKVSVKFGDGTRDVDQAVLETVPVFGGVIISAQEQFPRPKRGILLEALSPLEA